MPRPIRSIVAASDFSFSAHRAARRAAELAKAHSATLRLLHVIDGSTLEAFRSASLLELRDRTLIEARSALDSLADDAVGAGEMAAERVVREGAVIDQLLAAAAESDLLVLGARGLNPVRDFVLGSIAERVARKIASPMLVVKQDPQTPYHHVLVPVDFSEHSVLALRFAAELAPNATLHLFHALDFSMDRSLRSAGATDGAIDAHREEGMREANAMVGQLTAGMRDRTLSARLEPGDARTLIARRATEWGCTLIVMGKQGRAWLSEHVLGSVTRIVLERAACDVVVVPAAQTHRGNR